MIQNLLCILIPLLIIYPYIIAKQIDKNTKKLNNDKKAIFKNIIIISVISFITLIVLYHLLIIYVFLIPDSTSSSCINTGGWTYSCVGNKYISPIIMIILGIVITIHHFICQKYVYKIFENSNIFKYIFMYLYMGSIFFLNFLLSFYLYGVFVIVTFNSKLIELLRLIVFILPSFLFIISTYIYTKKNKVS